MRSEAETLLEVQLSQAGIPYEREYKFHPSRKWRADFMVRGRAVHLTNPPQTLHYDPLLLEVEGGTWSGGQHVRGKGFADGCEKQAAAVIAGYRYLRATTEQVNDGTALKWIQEALGLGERAA